MYPKTQTLIQKYIAEEIFPGAVYQFRTPEAVENQSLGWRQLLPSKESMELTTIFDVASLTKVICTTTVVLQLLEKGKLQIDAPLKEYLPEFENDSITLRHLLTHTSDIQTYIPQRDKLTALELRQAYYQLQPGADLGKKMQYTDAGTILLGFMLEKIFQKPVVTIFEEEVLRPLKMADSGFLLTDVSLVAPTENHPQLGILKGVTHDPKARVLAEHAGNAGLFTILGDVSKFVEMYLNFGETESGQFLKKSTITGLLQDQTPLENGNRSLGWDIHYPGTEGKPMLFHTGYTGTFILMDLLAGTSFIFLSNRVHPLDQRNQYIEKRNQLLTVYLAELQENKPF
ncbi:serine hydrolase domain-containing protein [Enterococcus sp. LJL90]